LHVTRHYYSAGFRAAFHVIGIGIKRRQRVSKDDFVFSGLPLIEHRLGVEAVKDPGVRLLLGCVIAFHWSPDVRSGE
jgi:hypothetical protein